jgi:hypothetical protein
MISKGGNEGGSGGNGMGMGTSMTDVKSAGGMEGGRKKTAWMAHVKATMRAHKGLKLKQVLKLAKKTYKKKSMRGGQAVITPDFVQSGAGRRRRGTRRSRRGGMYE